MLVADGLIEDEELDMMASAVVCVYLEHSTAIKDFLHGGQVQPTYKISVMSKVGINDPLPSRGPDSRVIVR